MKRNLNHNYLRPVINKRNNKKSSIDILSLSKEIKLVIILKGKCMSFKDNDNNFIRLFDFILIHLKLYL